MEKIFDGVWRGGTRYVNWYLLETGPGEAVVVDTGLPGYRRTLVRDVARTGHVMSDVKAVYLTHGHVDHTGTADVFAAAGAAVYLHQADREMAEGTASQRPERSILPYLRWPATLGFVVHAARNGAIGRPTMPPSRHPPVGGRVDGPAMPRVLPVSGHTAGSCVYEFPDHGVAFVGDVMCTVSPVTGRPAPAQLQSRASNASSERALASVDILLELEARTLLPGHGVPWTDGAEAAVASVRRRGCR
ncbi:MAG: MBL fold metallo-hydrolase [Aeromicrobium sp.]